MSIKNPHPPAEEMRSHLIGRVEFDKLRLKKDLKTIDGFQMSLAYSEYARGAWTTCMLVNRSGNKNDGLSEEFEGHGVPTEYGRQLPYILETIQRLFEAEHLKSARIFSAVNGFIKPHRDYLEFRKGFTRIHLALQTNDRAMNSERRTVYRMRLGELWFLDGRVTHSGGSFSNHKRLHLVLDFDPDVALKDLFRNPSDYQPGLMPSLIRRRPMSEQEWDSLLTSLGPILTELNYSNIFELVAKLHFDRDLDCEVTYDAMIRIATQSGNHKLVDRANSEQRYFLGDSRKSGKQLWQTGTLAGTGVPIH
jgi:hypothetical protein